MDYTNNYRHNLTLYWQQFYPDYDIPSGYHVHHIRPKCTFDNPADPRIHHPKNLIALHPDDHVSIHKNRGDTFVDSNFLWNIVGQKHTPATKLKMSKTRTGRKFSDDHKRAISEASLGKAGTRNGAKLSDKTKEKMSIAAIGRTRTEESKLKQSESCKGRVPWNKGKTMSDEYKQKCSDRMTGTKRGPYNK